VPDGGDVVGVSTPGRTRRVFLHVGSPKTGTTYLQNILWAARETARGQGLLLPQDRFADHYLASLDVRGLAARPEHPPRAVGMWQRIVDEVEGWRGDALVSHELFAGATREQAESALAAFGPQTEVHVVLTARDLLRQIPAEWQEHVKHRATRTLPAFVDRIIADQAGRSWFWTVQDYAGVLDRWGSSLPRSQVHVVTVPQRGADPTALWSRFAGLLGLDPATFDTAAGRGNLSLGVEQAELLRRVNAALGDSLPIPGPYPRVVKGVFAQQVLAGRRGTPLRLDRKGREFAVARSREIADELAALGVDVVGDLAELVPGPSDDDSGYPEASEAALVAEGVDALAALLTRMAERPRAEAEYRRQLAQMREMPVRYALLQASRRHPVLGRLRRAYQLGARQLSRGGGSGASGPG
jgi:hypothetical protein